VRPAGDQSGKPLQGIFPTAGELLVMAAWAVICGFAAVKLFRWE